MLVGMNLLESGGFNLEDRKALQASASSNAVLFGVSF
jgi:hypothetical protein